jgi:hypothetical protein
VNLETSIGYALRRAALHLHAMAPADQAWLLENLAPAKRSRLDALLQDLRSLGIPTDTALVQTEAQVPLEPAPSTPSTVERLQSLSGEEVAWLAGRLQNEPPRLAALLLAHQAWPWRQGLMERLEPPWRQCVVAAMKQPRLPLPEQALCEALVQLLPGRPGSRVATGKRWWKRLSFVSWRGAAST